MRRPVNRVGHCDCRDQGIDQHAYASGFTSASANVSLVNSGAIGINASANAIASASAAASASVDTGIEQSATATSLVGATFANANVSLTNSGTIGINAVANAAAVSTALC